MSETLEPNENKEEEEGRTKKKIKKKNKRNLALAYLFCREILFTCLSSARILWHKWLVGVA